MTKPSPPTVVFFVVCLQFIMPWLLKAAFANLLIAISPISHAYAANSPASILSHPPKSMAGINNHQDQFSGGLDPKIVTLGPTTGLHPELGSYDGKVGMNYEIPIDTPILAPLDSVFLGFNNRNSNFRNGMDGTLQSPFDDLQICFQSRSSDWPGLIYCFYHLKNSPLLRGINVNPDCSNSDEWPGPMRAEGLQMFPNNQNMLTPSEISKSCKGLIGKTLKRGAVVGYAGTVGNHSQAPIMVKVKGKSINPTVKMGDKYLHWVQPDVFFYWKCYSKKATFESGVLAYPFPCDGYKLPATQLNPTFKY